MDWSDCPDVERIPSKMSNAWVVRDTRVPVDAILNNAAAGIAVERITRDLYATVAAATM